MSGMLGIVSYGLGTLVGFIAIGVLIFWFIQDVTQKKHSVLRNYPVVGRLRYFFEKQGEYFRQYFFMNDREELPFNRSARSWVYRLAKAEGGIIGFGSTNNNDEPGSILFVNAPYPVLEEDRLPTPSLTIGEGYARLQFAPRSIINISGMSFGAISAPAVRSLSRGAAVAGAGWTRARAA
jgi:glutamate synthase domain-containing protein 2